jgi:hypothetical protein
VIFDSSSGTYNGDSYASTSSWLASKFTAGAQSDSLDSIQLNLNSQIPVAESGTIRLRLFTSNGAGTAPLADTGAVVPTEFVVLNNPNVVTPELFVPISPVLLSPHTSYWVVLSLDSGGVVGWIASLTPPTVSGGAYGRNLSDDSGMNWAGYDPASNYEMQVQATPTPEPTASTLLAAAIVTLGCGRLWHQARLGPKLRIRGLRRR